ncbi:hypothetical protein AYO41_03495 [Verrucomicrobia bacterium SCGC AG-212-E04]|nr:hypothetical protein AYO41_03495 [Verrucomicrobia bacterium SCGC AG-212-E04]
MKTGKIVLWIVVAVFAWIAVNSFSDSPGSRDPNTGGLVQALGALIGTVFAVAAAALALALLLWRSKTAVHPRNADENQVGDHHPPTSDNPNVAARPAPFWTMALGATAVALVAGLWAIVAGLNSSRDDWSFVVVPLLMLLAGGYFFGRFSRRRPWLVSLFLIVPNPILWFMLGSWLEDLGASPGSTGKISASALIILGALVAAPLIGVGLGKRFGPPEPPDPPPGPPDPVISERAAIIVAIIGVIISAVISLLINIELVPPGAAQVLVLTETIAPAGGLLIFFLALLMSGPWPAYSGKLKKAAIVVAIIGVIISAVISLIPKLRVLPSNVAQAYFLTSTISQAGGLLIFFFALLMREPGSPDLGKPVKTSIVVAIMGVIISAGISQLFNFGLVPPAAAQALSLTETILQAGGLLIFFFALLRRQEQVGK